MRTNRSLAASGAVLAVMLLLAANLAKGSDEVRAPRTPPPLHAGEPATGRSLFEAACASCHGADGAGTDLGPSLVGVGAAAADFQLRTGRMPFAGPTGSQATRKPPAFDDEQIQDLVAYVASLGEGPAIPDPVLDDELLSRGQELFTDNCAPCHGATGNGGAVGGGALAPALDVATPVQVQEALLTGPGQMPRFLLPDSDADAVATYVDYLQSAPNPGGFAIGGIGPVPEGFVAWVLGMSLLVLVAFLIGREWDRAGARNVGASVRQPSEDADR
jgi:ubiquinol-cytochrome c reductase cytochrome c subunit